MPGKSLNWFQTLFLCIAIGCTWRWLGYEGAVVALLTMILFSLLEIQLTLRG